MTLAHPRPRQAAHPIPAHVRAFGTRPAYVRDPEPHWIPARYVHADVPCSFCGFTIFACAPGNKTGTRGTKAYFNSMLNWWECIPCRQEALRAHGAQLELDNAAGRAA